MLDGDHPYYRGTKTGGRLTDSSTNTPVMRLDLFPCPTGYRLFGSPFAIPRE